MCQVYRNAHVVISGGFSGHCHESFLNNSRQEPLIIESKAPDGTPTIVHIKRSLRSGIHFVPESNFGQPNDIPEASSTLDPLDARGWTLQERDLSTRRVVYSTREAQWVCRTLSRCECFPEYQIPQTSTKEESNHLRWTNAVNELTQRNFTYNIDKLPAISGIASEIGSITHSEYPAGLWMNELPLQLLWVSKETQPLPESYIAPSFSWASINSEVVWPHQNRYIGSLHNVTYLTTVIEASCQRSTIDCFGRVNEWLLELQGPLKNGYLHKLKDNPRIHFKSDDGAFNGYAFHADAPLTPVVDKFSPSREMTVQRSKKGARSRFERTPIKFLIICSRPPPPFGVSYLYDAIVLGVSQTKESCYQRLGLVFNMNLNSGFDRNEEYIARIANERGSCTII